MRFDAPTAFRGLGIVAAGLLCLSAADGAWAKSTKASKSSKSKSSDAGFAPARGLRLMAPWGRMGKRYPGQVTDQYGKFVEVKFDDGYSGWCPGDLTNP